MEKKYKFSPKRFAIYYVYSLFLLILLSTAFSLYLHYSNVTEPIKSQISTGEVPQAIDQGLIFLGAVLISTLIILYIIIKKQYYLIRLIYISVFSLASFIFLALFLNPFYDYAAHFSQNLSFALTLFINFSLSVFLIYGIFYAKNTVLQNHALIVLSCIMGSILGEILQLIQLIIFILIFAVYDLVAVFVGTLKRIAKEIENAESALSTDGVYSFTRGMFINIFNIEIGIGDLLFYSAIAANLGLLGLIGFLYSFISITLGGIITIILAQKFKIFPGLPIPVFLTVLLVMVF